MPREIVRELFLYDLSVMLNAEQMSIFDVGTLVGEIHDSQVESVLQDHSQTTERQIQNLMNCFNGFFVQPVRVTCYVLQAIIGEHDQLVRNAPPPDLLRLYDLDAIISLKTFEIVSYESLIEKAKALGRNDCTRLLDDNLRVEKDVVSKLGKIRANILGQIIPPRRMRA